MRPIDRIRSVTITGRSRRETFDRSQSRHRGRDDYLPGLPGPVISVFMSYEASRSHYEPGTEFQIGRIDMVANTGTYVDAPAHRFAAGPTWRTCRWSASPTCPSASSARTSATAIEPSARASSIRSK